MKFLMNARQLAPSLAMLFFSARISHAQTNICVSREYSIFQFNQLLVPIGTEGSSREYSLFQFNQSSVPNGIDAISRESSGYNYGSNRLNVAVGSTVVQAGTAGGVPVTVSTIVPMSNVLIAVDFPPNLLSNWWVQAQPPYAGSVLASNNSRLYLTFSNATAGQTIQNSNQVLGLIQFASASNQPSAFLPLPVAGVTPTLVNANAFAPSRTVTGNGEVVVIYTNALLRMYRGTNNQMDLTLYGLNGTNYIVQSATNLIPPINWQTAFAGVPLSPGTNLIGLSPNFTATNKMTLFRAQQ